MPGSFISQSNITTLKAIIVSFTCLAFTFFLMLILLDVLLNQLLDRTIIPLNCYYKCHLFSFVNFSASKLLTIQSTNVLTTTHFTAERYILAPNIKGKP